MSSEPTPRTVLEARNVTKAFMGFKALDDVSFALHAGEVHGLMGENGAGKSTLIKALTGFHAPDAGQLFLQDKPVRFASPRESQNAGVSAVYQEINLIPERSVAENIMLGREPKRFGLIDRRRMLKEVGELLERYRIAIKPGMMLSSLGLGMQQMVAIARAMATGALVVILDEPTSALSGSEVDLLFDLVNRLRDDGVAILFVSHRLSECYTICDRLTVLRDGRLIKTERTQNLSKTDLITAMLGHERGDDNAGPGNKQDLAGKSVVLEAEDLSWRDRVHDVSLNIRSGEVVGLVGLLGSGRTETFKAIFGAEKPDHGQIRLNGTALNRLTPAASIDHGIAFLPEDRRSDGIFSRLPVRENLTATTLSRLGKAGFVSRRKQRDLVHQFIKDLRIKSSGPQQPISELSGGNQQKVLLARCLATRPKAILLDDPTRGIDVGAKDEVHAVIRELAGEGMAVLVTSSEVEELLTICDRLVVISEGAISGELDVASTSPDDVLDLLAGGSDHSSDRAGGERAPAS